MTDDGIWRVRRHISKVDDVQISGVGQLMHLEDRDQIPGLNEMTAFLDRILEKAGLICRALWSSSGGCAGICKG